MQHFTSEESNIEISQNGRFQTWLIPPFFIGHTKYSQRDKLRLESKLNSFEFYFRLPTFLSRSNALLADCMPLRDSPVVDRISCQRQGLSRSFLQCVMSLKMKCCFANAEEGHT